MGVTVADKLVMSRAQEPVKVTNARIAARLRLRNDVDGARGRAPAGVGADDRCPQDARIRRDGLAGSAADARTVHRRICRVNEKRHGTGDEVACLPRCWRRAVECIDAAVLRNDVDDARVRLPGVLDVSDDERLPIDLAIQLGGATAGALLTKILRRNRGGSPDGDRVFEQVLAGAVDAGRATSDRRDVLVPRRYVDRRARGRILSR